MLIQVLEKIQAPQITPIALLRLLFEFKEPFDKDLAMKDWVYFLFFKNSHNLF